MEILNKRKTIFPEDHPRINPLHPCTEARSPSLSREHCQEGTQIAAIMMAIDVLFFISGLFFLKYCHEATGIRIMIRNFIGE